MPGQQPVGAKRTTQEAALEFAKLINDPVTNTEIAELYGGMPVVVTQIELLAADLRRRCGIALDRNPGTSHTRIPVPKLGALHHPGEERAS